MWDDKTLSRKGKRGKKKQWRHDARDHDLLHCFPPQKPHFCEALISAIYLLLLSKIPCSLRIQRACMLPEEAGAFWQLLYLLSYISFSFSKSESIWRMGCYVIIFKSLNTYENTRFQAILGKRYFPKFFPNFLPILAENTVIYDKSRVHEF